MIDSDSEDADSASFVADLAEDQKQAEVTMQNEVWSLPKLCDTFFSDLNIGTRHPLQHRNHATPNSL
jgi:hypothetical protein